jgi:para-nitrobenzyl esterase
MGHSTRLLPLALLIALLGGCSQSSPVHEPDPLTQREIAQGKLVGFSHKGAHVWRGIPFARPPVGDLRWRAPRPPEAWSGLLEAVAFGDVCPQIDFSGERKGGEDCLSLNVYAPGDPGEDEGPLPVMFFIHGGGNSIGDATVYDASRLASENRVVVVVVQYRLGVLGWFAHPALRATAKDAEDASGNFATLDLIRGLEWVRDNIAAFGGDSERVTIFGESAGGVNVYSLLLSPRAKGLFHGAISQSGFVTSFPIFEAENAIDSESQPGLPGSSTEVLLSLLEADDRADDREAAKVVLAQLSESETADYLRAKSADEILGVFSESGQALGGMYFAPFVLRDGTVIEDRDAMEALATGAYNRVPVVVGTNRDEHRLFQAFSSPHVAHLGPLPVRIKDLDRYHRVTEYGSKLWKAGGADEPATAMRQNQSQVWGYRFDWDEERKLMWLDLADLIGAGHAIELLFVFGGTNSDVAKRMLIDDQPSAEKLSAQMRSYWAHFAATGDPGSGQQADLPLWPAWADEKPRFMVFDSPRDAGLHTSGETLTTRGVIQQVASDPRISSEADRCEIYASFVQWSAEMTPEEYRSVGGGICAAYPLETRTPGG